MKETYQITIVDGVPVIEVEGKKVLVDTGSPQTFGNVGNLKIMGKERSIPKTLRMAGVQIESISESIGENIGALMGLDILADYCVSWDYQKREMTISDEACEKEEGAVEVAQPQNSTLSSLVGMLGMSIKKVAVLIEMNVAGNDIVAFIDTGAKTSYLLPALTNGLESEEEVEDFNPLIGKFTTKIYSVKTSIGGVEIPTKYGTLPSMFASVISQVNAKAVIGRDLFEAAKVTIDFISGKVYIQKY